MARLRLIKAICTGALMLGMAHTSAASAQDRPFSVRVQGDYFIGTGVIDGRTPGRLSKALQANPGIKVLVLYNVPGSDNDEANLQASRMIRKAGLTTVVPAKGLVASGGTDMFLAGKRRIIEQGACVGVHSWAAGNREGADFPDSSREHDLYLNYYRSIGINPEFYWYTLDAAGADEMHWASVNEMNQFRMATSRLKFAGESENRRYARCDRR